MENIIKYKSDNQPPSSCSGPSDFQYSSDITDDSNSQFFF